MKGFKIYGWVYLCKYHLNELLRGFITEYDIVRNKYQLCEYPNCPFQAYLRVLLDISLLSEDSKRPSVSYENFKKGNNEPMTMVEKTKEPLPISEVLNRQLDAKPLRSLINQSIVIQGFEILNGRRGEIAILSTPIGKFYTFSGVIIDQLKRVEGKFPVKATVVSTGRYMRLA